MAKGTLFQVLTGSAIDAEAGIIRGVSVVTAGEAKGHGVFVDAKTLQQVQQYASEFKGGLKVKAKHGTNFDAIVGNLRNFSVNGDKVIADLHLLKTHAEFSHILEMAKEMPESFGLSIAFSMSKEKIDGKEFARCSEIYGADMVDAPAANPTGLFTTNVDTPPEIMNLDKFIEQAKAVFGKEPTPENFEAKFTTAQTQLSEATGKIPKFEADLKAANEEVAKLKASQTEFDAKVETAASAKAGEIVAKMGVPPVKTPAAENPANAGAGTVTRAEFTAMPAKERTEFCKKGGKITE